MAHRIGPYVIFDKIAAGGTASVHLARDARGPARCLAVKRLHPHLAGDAQLGLMMLDEGRLTRRIRSPFVVQTVDVVVEAGEIVVVMEHVLGEALSALLRRGGRERPAAPAVVAAILVDVLRGLHAAHELTGEDGTALHLVHRDVSPQNVLVGADGIARVVDFGIAKAVGRVATTQAGALKGKLAYMAPEQLLGRGVDRRTDLFAASTVLWEALTGQRLFGGVSEATTVQRIIGGTIAPPSTLREGVPQALDAVVLRGLAREPSERFATADEMAVAISAAVDLASPADVARWVDLLVHDEIEERRARLAALEHDAEDGR
ncbi:MAG: serine/threonine-protein kinase [Polyangiaceae bacterium]